MDPKDNMDEAPDAMESLDDFDRLMGGLPEMPAEEAPIDTDPALRSPLLRRPMTEEPLPERQIPVHTDEEEAPEEEDFFPEPKHTEPTPEPQPEPASIPKLDRRERRNRSQSRTRDEGERSMPRMNRPGSEEPLPGAAREEAPVEPPKEAPKKKEPAKKNRPKAIRSPEVRWKQALQGQGSRNVRLLLCLILTIGALFLGFVRSQGLLDGYPNQELFGFGEMGLLALCAICAYDVFADGLEILTRPGFSLDTLVLLETLVVLADAFFALQTQRASYCPLMCLMLVCALWGKRSRVQAEADVMDAARKTDGTKALVRQGYFMPKLPAVLWGKGSMRDFLQANDKTVGPERVLHVYAGMVVVASITLGAVNSGGSTAAFTQYTAASMLLGTPLMSFLVWTRPWAILSARLKEKGAAVYGWTGIRRLCGKLAVPVSEEDLFPRGGIKPNGVKFYPGHEPNRVVSFGAAVCTAAGSSMAPIFQEQMKQRGSKRYTVTALRWYSAGGIGADVGSSSVLVGSLKFMQIIGVEMPSGTKVNQAVYVAIDGTLAGCFAMNYTVLRSVRDALSVLCACRGVVPVITAVDFMINAHFLQHRFNVSTSNVRFPTLSARGKLGHQEPDEDAPAAVLAAEPGFDVTVQAVTGARSVHTAFRWGLALSLISGIMGLVIAAVLAGLSAGGILSVSNLTLFVLIWAVPMFLLTGWPKSA